MDGDIEDMDTTPSPIEDTDDVITEPHDVITIKEEMVEECELVQHVSEQEDENDRREDEEVEEVEDEEEQFTETEKQIQDIMEENDRPSFEADLDKYLKTETSDRAAIHATIQRNRLGGPQPYFSKGFEVCELFPKKDYTSYFLIVDGYKMQLNTKRSNAVVFRCRYHDVGCSARYKLMTGTIGKANEHNHKNVTEAREDGVNKHFTCVYCNQTFNDLAERKNHVLNEPHINAPWPMDEELCIFAEYRDDAVENSTDTPADRIDVPEGNRKLQPNIDKVAGRILIHSQHDVTVLRPNEKRPPIVPKSLPYPRPPIRPKITAKSTPRRNMADALLSKKACFSPAVSESDSNEAGEETILKIKNSNAKKNDSASAESRRRSSRPKEMISNYAAEGKFGRHARDMDADETDSGRSSPAVKKNEVRKKKKIVETNDGTPLVTKKVHVVKKKKNKDDEVQSVPQRIDNVIEEYEDKVVLHCNLCDVKLNSLKHRADHNMSEEHQENKRRLIEENARCRASLAFNKPIFTEEFLVYNKALEAELRSLRKGAVELEEQNAVLSSHITELTDVVKELRNAKAIMQRQHSTLDLHLKDLKSELSKVFANVLSTEVSSENFNETFNKLSVAITGKGGNKRAYSDGITTKLKRHLKQARIDTVAL